MVGKLVDKIHGCVAQQKQHCEPDSKGIFEKTFSHTGAKVRTNLIQAAEQ